jgi:ABC-type nitrate/sulfonate/bicarbonate transport system substrate-binding protein
MADTIRLGFFSTSVVSRWAQEHGTFADHGLVVEELPVTSSPQQFSSLLAGEYDVVLTSPDNVATYVLNEQNPLGRRLDLLLLRAVDGGSRLSLVADAAIGRLEDVAGKRFGVDVPTSGFAYVAYALLRTVGLEPHRDYAVVTAGATPRRRQLLADGEFDVTLLNAGHEARAVRDGARVLGEVSDVVTPYLGSVLATVAGGRTDAVERFLAAWTAAEREILDPAAAEDVLALLQREPDTDRGVAEALYGSVLDPVHGLCVGGGIDPAALENVLRLRAASGGFERDLDIAALSRPGGGLVPAPSPAR